MSGQSRRLALCLACAFSAFAVYGSLVPLDFQPITITEAWRRFGRSAFVPLSDVSKTDLISNVALYVPIGLCLAAAFRWRSRGFVVLSSLVLVGSISAILSLTVEFLQTFVPARITSLNDVVANTTGALMGAILWPTVGMPLSAAARSIGREQPEAAPFVIALSGYIGLLLIALWVPFDVTLRPAEILEKYREGRISLQLLDSGPLWRTFLEATAVFALWAPVGWLVETANRLWRPSGFIQLNRDPRFGWPRTGRPARRAGAFPVDTAFGAEDGWGCPRTGPEASRPIQLKHATRRVSPTLSVMLAVAVVACAEFGQVFVYSRFAHLQDLWVGGAGAIVGAMVAVRCRRPRRPVTDGRAAS